MIQAAMGWKNYHLYEFVAGEERFGESDPDDPYEVRPAASSRPSSVLTSAGDHLIYTYDFGDEWRHEVLLEDLPEASEHRTYPVCLAGDRPVHPRTSVGPMPTWSI
jgi:hypothetical protein